MAGHARAERDADPAEHAAQRRVELEQAAAAFREVNQDRGRFGRRRATPDRTDQHTRDTVRDTGRGLDRAG